MKRSKFTDSQIIDALKGEDYRVDVALGVPDVCRELGISSTTIYKWRTKSGGMDTSIRKKALWITIWHTLIENLFEYRLLKIHSPPSTWRVRDKSVNHVTGLHPHALVGLARFELATNPTARVKAKTN
jgi:hypothetical protein